MSRDQIRKQIEGVVKVTASDNPYLSIHVEVETEIPTKLRRRIEHLIRGIVIRTITDHVVGESVAEDILSSTVEQNP